MKKEPEQSSYPIKINPDGSAESTDAIPTDIPEFINMAAIFSPEMVKKAEEIAEERGVSAEQILTEFTSRIY